MARTVIEEMGRLSRPGDKPPKCLVVMNYRHAFDLTGRSPGATRRNTFEFVKDAFGDRAANVFLHAPIIVSVPVAGGLWDAAFERTGNRPAGFDFEGSPFGEDAFDMFPFLPNVRYRLRYKDVFTGFVFDGPIEDQYTQNGIPGYYAGFEAEVLRRARLVSEENLRAQLWLMQREKDGDVATKEEVEVIGRKLETLVEMSLMVLNGVGLLIGLGAAGACALRRRGTGNQPSVCA
jgi:hypothetical protein